VRLRNNLLRSALELVRGSLLRRNYNREPLIRIRTKPIRQKLGSSLVRFHLNKNRATQLDHYELSSAWQTSRHEPLSLCGDKKVTKNVTKNTRHEKCAEIKSHARHPSLANGSASR
jgi:hypothetical protein